MAVVYALDGRKTKISKGLQSKKSFDTFSEINKPEFVDSGLRNKTADSVYESDSTRQNGNLILSHAPNFYKKNGVSMENLGYFIIPRSVTSDPRYQSARLKYKHVLNCIFENVAFENTFHAIGSEKIEIKVGQYCVTIRKLAEICNQNVKHKEDLVTKNCVDRAITYFEKCQFVGQEVRHGKSILTITVPEFYKNKKITSETTSGTKVGQDRDTKEERKEHSLCLDNSSLDPSYIKETNDISNDRGAVAPVDSFLKNGKYKKAKIELSDEKKTHLQILWKFSNDQKIADGLSEKPGIKEKDLVGWLKDYTGKEIMECLKLAVKATIKQTYGGYVARLLKERVVKKEDDSKIGRAFVEEFIKKNKMTHIDLKQDYFKDLISDEQAYYRLPKQTLETILKKSMERFLERQQEQNDQW